MVGPRSACLIGMSKPKPCGHSWADGVQVDEQRLKEYFHQKQHSLLLRGAANSLKHTLVSVPTTIADDGMLHFGDSLMLRNGETEGLLQADIADPIPHADATRPDVDGISLSTGRMIASCPRNVVTISRASDNDGFGQSSYVHYGQAFRMGANSSLSDKALYLFSCQRCSEDLGQDETLACLYPRAVGGTRWRILHADPKRRNAAKNDPVRLQEPIALQNEATGHLLSSDRIVRMNHYGNEWRVFGAAEPENAASSTSTWSFVDSTWAEDVVQAARARHALDARAAKDIAGLDAGPDPGELLCDPVAAADHELALLEREVADYSVLLRIYPQLRRSGMHQVRRFRRMCMSADVDHTGQLPARTFEGVLSWVGVRLQDGELQKLTNLFETEPESNVLDYRGFFKYMEANMSEARVAIVEDAYAKLQATSCSGYVEVHQLQQNWNPRCHPEVGATTITEVEAMEEFLNQWDLTSSDGMVSYDEFLDYYRDVSMAVEKGEIFVDIVRKAWDL